MHPLYKILFRHIFCSFKGIEEFITVNCEHYFQNNSGVLAGGVSKVEEEEELKCEAFFWRQWHYPLYALIEMRLLLPEMAKEVAEMHKGCAKCQETLDVGKSLFVKEAGDWRQSYLEFFQHQLLPLNHTNETKI